MKFIGFLTLAFSIIKLISICTSFFGKSILIQIESKDIKQTLGILLLDTLMCIMCAAFTFYVA